MHSSCHRGCRPAVRSLGPERALAGDRCGGYGAPVGWDGDRTVGTARPLRGNPEVITARRASRRTPVVAPDATRGAHDTGWLSPFHPTAIAR